MKPVLCTKTFIEGNYKFLEGHYYIKSKSISDENLKNFTEVEMEEIESGNSVTISHTRSF